MKLWMLSFYNYSWNNLKFNKCLCEIWSQVPYINVNIYVHWEFNSWKM